MVSPFPTFFRQLDRSLEEDEHRIALVALTENEFAGA